MEKISKIFLDYVEPLLEFYQRPDPETKAYEAALLTAWTVWNAVIHADVCSDHSFIDKMYFSTEDELIKMIFDVMLIRKRTDFAKHKFFLGEYKIITKKDGSMSLRVQAKESQEARVH